MLYGHWGCMYLWNYGFFQMCGEGNGTPLQYSCLEYPMDGGAWKAAIHGAAEGWTGLSDFTFTFHFSLSCVREENGNPLQFSCLENPRDRGAWWAAVYGVAQSRTRLKWLSSSGSIYILNQIVNRLRTFLRFTYISKHIDKYLLNE